MLLCNSAIKPKHFSLKRCPLSCPLITFPDFVCTKFSPSRDSLHRVPCRKPDETALLDLKYLSFDSTPITSLEGNPSDIDDYQPRSQIKRRVKVGKPTLEDSESIVEFSKTFAVQELHVRKYLEHLQYLDLKKTKRKDNRKRQRETESQKTYADYNWEQMFTERTMKKLKLSALNLFLKKHKLGNTKSEQKREAGTNFSLFSQSPA